MRIQRRAWVGMFAIILALVATSLSAQRGDDSSRLSKNGKTEGTIDGIDVTLEFGRPSVKDRVIWGGLVPYGRVWRTGADECSTINLSADALIEGQPLSAGKYSLFTIPGEDEWTVIFNTVAEQWGSFNYDESKDALRVQVKPGPSEFVETLDFEIDGPAVVLHWAELAVPFNITAAD